MRCTDGHWSMKRVVCDSQPVVIGSALAIPTEIQLPECVESPSVGEGVMHNCIGVTIRSSCTASCLPGYVMNRDWALGAPTFTCEVDRSFSGSAPDCAAPCEELQGGARRPSVHDLPE